MTKNIRKEKIEKKLLSKELSDLKDVVKRFGNLSVSQTCSNRLSYEISNYLFNKLKNINTEISVKDVYKISDELEYIFDTKYLIIERNLFRKK